MKTTVNLTTLSVTLENDGLKISLAGPIDAPYAFRTLDIELNRSEVSELIYHIARLMNYTVKLWPAGLPEQKT